jgi:hypothetical protein
LRRFYLTVPYSARERSGSPSAIKEVPLTFLPDKVPAVRVAMSGRTITVEWEPSGGVLGWLLERPLPPEVPLAAPASAAPATAAPASSGPAPAPGSPAVAPSAPPASGTTLYNIYREISPDPLAPPRPAQPVTPWVKPLPTPVNPQPQPGLTFIEQDVPFDDRERCYDVRAVRGSGAQQVESEPSERRCVVSIDLEPPTVPTGLMATAVEGMGVFLRWDPNGEDDLRGYVVLRGEAGDDTLQTLTREPLAEPRYTDASAVAGRTYRYVVRAVDTRIPLPNESDPTDVTVTAR